MIKWRLNRSISRIDYGTTPFQVTKQKCKLWKGSLVRGSGNGSELMHYHYSVCPKFLKTLSFLSGICSPRIWQVNKFWWPSAFSSACQKKQTCHISFFLVLPDYHSSFPKTADFIKIFKHAAAAPVVDKLLSLKRLQA